jgi:hypothetical protein
VCFPRGKEVVRAGSERGSVHLDAMRTKVHLVVEDNAKEEIVDVDLAVISDEA